MPASVRRSGTSYPFCDQKPLRSDLEVARPKAQALRRIEDLEEREREKKEVWLELVPAIEAWGTIRRPWRRCWAARGCASPSGFLNFYAVA